MHHKRASRSSVSCLVLFVAEASHTASQAQKLSWPRPIGREEQSAALSLNSLGYHRGSFPLFTGHIHCQVSVQDVNLKIPRVSLKLKHLELHSQWVFWIPTNATNDFIAQPELGKTLMLSHWFGLVRGRSLQEVGATELGKIPFVCSNWVWAVCSYIQLKWVNIQFYPKRRC